MCSSQKNSSAARMVVMVTERVLCDAYANAEEMTIKHVVQSVVSSASSI
jgi:hypothetical protein